MTDRLFRFVSAFAWMALIFALSSRERFPQPPGFSLFSLSVVAHLFLYGVLALFLMWAVYRNGHPTRSMQLLVILATALYGLSDEFHQSFVPGRDASGFDLIVDAIGASIAVGAWTYWRAIRSTDARQ